MRIYWWQKVLRAFGLTANRQQQPYVRKRLHLELLEDRLAPATFSPTTFADLAISSTAVVNTMGQITDQAGDPITLRSAVIAANANGDMANTINLNAGTYQLTIVGNGAPGAPPNDFDPTIGDLNVDASGLTINGAGAGATIIQQTTANDRVFDVNENFLNTFDFTIEKLTIEGGSDTTADGGGGAIFAGAAVSGLTDVENVQFLNNQSTGSGSAGGGAILVEGGDLTVNNSTFGDGTGANANTTTSIGGAIAYDSFGTTGTFTLTNSTFNDNSANGTSGSEGGAIAIGASNAGATTANISGSAFLDNSSTADDGGAIAVDAGNLTVTTSNFDGNSAGGIGLGGAIRSDGASTVVTDSRFVNNTASAGPGQTLEVGADATTFTADDNWWGANAGPSATDLGSDAGAPTIDATTWLQLRNDASPGAIDEGQTTTVTADLYGQNIGGPAPAGSLNDLPVFPVPSATIFSNPQLGTLSSADTQFVNGVATVTYTASTTAGAGSVDATADNQTITADIDVISLDHMSVALVGGKVIVTDTTVAGADDNVTLQTDGTQFIITNPVSTLSTTIPGATVSANGHTVFVPFNGATTVTATTPIDVNTLAGNDKLTVDWSLGNFQSAIAYDGGAGSNTLAIKGAFQTATETFTTTGPGDSGLLQLNDGADPVDTINYVNLAPVDMTGSTAANLVFNLPAGTVGAALEDDGVANNGLSELVSTNATFETTTFADPTKSLTINAGGGADTISTLDTNNNVPFSGDFNAALTINGTAATDTVNLNALTLGNAGANTGALMVTAATINVLGAIDTTAGSAGAVTMTAGTSLIVAGTGSITASTGNITLDADTLSLGGAVNAGAGIVTLDVVTANRAIDLGTNPSPGNLGIGQSDLNEITAGILRIGDSSGFNANITVTSAITDVGTGWDTLSLRSNSGVDADISQNSGATLTVTNLNATSAGAVTLTEAGNAVSQLSGYASGAFTFVNSTGLTVGNVDPALGHPGLQSGFGATIRVTLAAAGDLLTISNAIDTTVFAHSADVTLSADDMAINAAIKAPGHTVTLEPTTSGRAIDLGTNTAGTLGLTQAELANITAGTLQIGSSTAGAISVSAAVTAPATWNTLILVNNSTVTEAAAGALSVANLAINTPGAVTLGSANDVTTLAASVTGAVTFNNGANALTVGTVAGDIGITTSNSDIDLSADSLDLTQQVNAGTGIVTLAPSTTTLAIDLGAASVPGVSFGLTQTELDEVTAGILRIGNTTDTGGIAITAAISDVGQNWNTLSLINGSTGQNPLVSSTTGAITQTAALTVTNLAVQAVGGVQLTNAGNDVDTLAGSVTGAIVIDQNFRFVDTPTVAGTTLTVGSVDGVAGITVAGREFLELTTAGALTLTNGLFADIVGLSAGGAVTQGNTAAAAINTTATGPEEALELLGAGPYTLTNTNNAASQLAGQVTNAVNYTNNGALTIADFGYADNFGGTVNGLSTSGAAITVTASSITIDGPINAGAGAVNLTATTTISQAASGFVTGGLLTTSSATGTDLSAATNDVTSFNASNSGAGVVKLLDSTATLTVTGISDATTGGPVTVNNTGGAVRITGAVNAGTNAVNLTASTTIGQTAVGVITGGLLTTSSATGTDLSAATNAVTSFNATNSGAGVVNLLDSTATLSVTGISNTTVGGPVTVNNTGGALSITGALNAGTNAVNLTASTSIGQTAAGIITGGLLTTSSATGADLSTATNGVTSFNASNSGVGVVNLLDSTATLTVTGISDATAGGPVTVNNTGGAIVLTGAVNAGTNAVNLTASTAISQTAGGITGGLLTTSSTTGTTLNGANAVTSFIASNTTSGNISLTNTAAPLIVTGLTEVAGGTVTINNTGAVTFPNALTGGYNLNDTSSGLTTFSAAVGNPTPLASVSVANDAAINGGSVTTTGTQTYGNVTINTNPATLTTTDSAVTINGTTTLNVALSVNDGAGSTTFTGAVNGANALAVTSTGTTTFSASVGNLTPLASVTVTGGTTAINGGSVTTSGSQTYAGSMTLGANADLTHSGVNSLVIGAATGTGTLTFNGHTLTDTPVGAGTTGTITDQLTGSGALLGGGASELTVTIGTTARGVVHVAVATTMNISGVTITGGLAGAGNGGGVLNDGTLTLTSSVVANNSATNGGGIFSDGTLNLDGDTIGGSSAAAKNTATTSGGGIAMSAGSVNFINNATPVEFNVAGVDGGGLDATGGTLTFSVAASVTNNTATTGNGGGIAFPTGTVTLPVGSVVNDNAATAGVGGGIDASTVNLTGASVDGNSAGSLGGGINAGTVNATGADISSNQAGSHGGGINAGSIDITALSTVNNNAAIGFGGGIDAGGGTLASSTVNGNTAGGFGGGIDVTATGLTVTNSTIDTNKAAFSGGGIFFGGAGALTIDPSHIDNNTAAGDGGGLFINSGALALSAGSTVNGNTSTFGNGGGIAIEGGTGHGITGSTIAGNTADLAGGGVYDTAGTLTIDSTTLGGVSAATKNSASANGGGIAVAGGTVTLQNATQVEGNTAVTTGGGVSVSSGALTLNDASIGGATATAGNTAGTNGGGIDVTGGVLQLTAGSIVSNNIATTGNGGGIDLEAGAGLVTISASSIAGNSATLGTGGGINVESGYASTLTINLASTVTGNQAKASAGGGLNIAGGTVTIDASTVGGTTTVASNANSAATSGGGINVTGTGVLNLTDSALVQGNSAATTGGGVNIAGSGTLNLNGATIGGTTADLGNTANTSGGGIALSATGTLTFAGGIDLIEQNVAQIDGGGLEITGGTTTFTVGTLIESNAATTGAGGGINLTGGASIGIPSTVTIDKNSAKTVGGGIDMAGSYTNTLTLTGATVGGAATANKNTAASGGGVNVAGGALIVQTAATIANNQATAGNGGGIDIQATAGNVTLTASTVASNSASALGGGINVESGYANTLTLTSATIGGASAAAGNSAGASGGGVAIASGTFAITGASIAGNLAGTAGGGVSITGGLGGSITGSTITANTATTSGGGVNIALPAATTVTLTSDTIGGPSVAAGNAAPIGGGLNASSGTVNASASTFSFNTASTSGGGLDFTGAATIATLTNDTIANNTGAGGDGIHVAAGSLTMLFDTVAFNTVGGVNNTGGTVKSQNSLFASNTGFDYQGTLSSQGNNLFQLPPASGTVPTDLVDQAPMLAAVNGVAAPANYGGATQTIALLPGSAALGAAAPVAVVVDQRGEPRPASPDIGAFQSQGFTTTSVSGPAVGTEVKTLIDNDFASPFGIAVAANAKTPAVASVAGNTITFVAAPSPALTAGEAVFYQAGSPGIGGLTDGGTYFVSNPTATTLQLSSTPGGAIVPLTTGAGTFYLEPVQGGRVVFSATPVAGAVGSATSSGIAGDTFDASQVGNTLTFASTPNFFNGEPVVYHVGGTGTGGIPGLTADTVTYFVKIPNLAAPDIIQLSLTPGGAPVAFTGNGTTTNPQNLLPIAVEQSVASSSLITLNSAVFNNGDLVTYHGAGVTNLVNGKTYYVIVTNPGAASEIIRLVAAATGPAGPALTALNGFNGTQTFTLAAPAGAAAAIKITNANKVVSSINFTAISASDQVSFLINEPVIYNPGAGAAIGGLVSGKLYYVVSASNASAVQLSATKGGAAINFTTPVAATLEQALLPADLVTAVNSASTLTLASAPAVGAALVFNGNAAATLGLASGQTYYVIKVTGSVVTLALTPGGAAITTLTPVGPVTGGQSFEPAASANPTFDFLPSAATVTGSTIQFTAPVSLGFFPHEQVVYDNGGGANITGLLEGHTYFIASVSANTITLSSSSTLTPVITGLAAPAGVPTLNSLNPVLTYASGAASLATPVLANNVSNPPGTPYAFTASAGGKNAGATIAWKLFNQSVTSLVYTQVASLTSSTPQNTNSGLNDVTFGSSHLATVAVHLYDQDGTLPADQVITTTSASSPSGVTLSAVYSADGYHFTAYAFDAGTGTTFVNSAAGVANFSGANTPNLQIWTSRYPSTYSIAAGYKNPDGAAVPLGNTITPPFRVLPDTIAIAAGNFGGFDQTVLDITIASSVRGPVRLIDYTIGGTALKTNQVEVIAFDFAEVGTVRTITFATAYNGPLTLSAFQNNSGVAGAAIPLTYNSLAYNGGNLGFMTAGTITLSNVTPAATGAFFLDSETDSGVLPVGFVSASTTKNGYSFNRSNLGRQRGR